MRRSKRLVAGPQDPETIATHPPYRRLIERILAAKRVAGADAEDLRQEILLAVVLAASARAVASVERLIVQVSRRRLADHFRRNAVRRSAAYDDEQHATALPDSQRTIPAPDRICEDRERAGALPLLLERMDPELREVFRLLHVEEMTLAEATSALDLPESTVRGRRDRARERFEELKRRVALEIDPADRVARRRPKPF